MASSVVRALRFTYIAARALLSVAAGLASTSESISADEPVAVFSRVFNGYKRVQLPDGSFKPERYSFGEGGRTTRSIDDPSLDKLTFLEVARAAAGPLRVLNYVPGPSPEEADQLILVFWGSVQGTYGHDSTESTDRATAAVANNNRLRPLDPSALPTAESVAAEADASSALWELGLANDERDRLENKNARILGYDDSLERARFVPHMAIGQDVFADLGDNRYFIVLQAYDFPTAVKEKKMKPLWTARISVREHGDFAEALNAMVWSATRYLGQDSGGLRRTSVNKGKVKMGPLEVIGAEEPE